MVNTLKKHIKNLEQFDKHRIFWLRLSGFVAIAILLTVIDWALLGVNNIYWVLVSTGLVLSAIWWYWTMRLVKELLTHRMAEIQILSEIVSDIKEIKDDVKNINH